jgi:hypothetical protein
MSHAWEILNKIYFNCGNGQKKKHSSNKTESSSEYSHSDTMQLKCLITKI